MMDWKTVDPETLTVSDETDLLIADVLGLRYGPLKNSFGRVVGYHLLGSDNQIALDKPVPSYSRWIVASMRLPITPEVTWRLTIFADGRTSAYLEQNIEGKLPYEWKEPIFTDPATPLAMCKVWLAWKQAQL
jgi:hypothetical protein